MLELRDPFSFIQLPKAEDHVNEAFEKLDLTEKDAPTFYAFLVQALTPFYHITRANSQSFNFETSVRLNQVISDIRFARSQCQSYFPHGTTLPEHLLIVTAMPSLREYGYHHLSDMMRQPHHIREMAAASHLFHASCTVDAERGLRRSLYTSMSPVERLTVELKACLVADDAISRFERGHSPESLKKQMDEIARLRPIMVHTDSLMARHFHRVAQRLDVFMRRHGHAGTPRTSIAFGDRLRREAAARLGLKTAERAPEQPARQQTGNVVVPFRRTKPAPGPQVV